jgi:hypothetical protein
MKPALSFQPSANKVIEWELISYPDRKPPLTALQLMAVS